MNKDIKVEQVGEPVADDGSRDVVELEFVREQVRQFVVGAFPRGATTERGAQRIVRLVDHILDLTRVRQTNKISAERDRLAREADRAARHRCNKCASPMLPHENMCRVCEVRALRERDRNLQFLIQSAARSLHQTSKLVDSTVKDGAAHLSKEQLEELNCYFWRVYSLLGVALDEPLPASTKENPWALLGALPFTGMAMSVVMDVLRKNKWTTAPDTEPAAETKK